ncbi:hypothetical protein LS482_09635 [Sinomicrobium kalidii]|uniref:hypothetical protein n=1 Tax=Sinomicrobium kalidii TaxID=2900738 RepID=UPI001E63EAEC|nr:hypothetical protein [Sinomicrobium kalidii]UGU18128.1 hypothetical protein LS482_09635 [Sinomicrobium kalidii]
MNKKASHRIIAIFLLLSFMPGIFPVHRLWASNNGPTAPEATGFEPVDATDMVNLVTGDFSYVLPLLNVPSPEGGYPVALSYHGGIALDQEASWVGLGWNVNPGAINRGVNGYPDDWGKTEVSEFFYDHGWTEDYYSFSAGVTLNGSVSVGLGVSWGSGRSMGGYVSASVGLGDGEGGASIGGRIGTNGAALTGGIGTFYTSVGTNGIGIGYGIDAGNDTSVGVNLNYNYNEGLSVGTSVTQKGSERGKSTGLGISFSSRGYSAYGMVNGYGAGISNASNGVSASDYDVSTRSSSFFLPLYIFYIGYSKTNVRYSLYKYNHLYTSGMLYPVLANTLKPYENSGNLSRLLYEDHFMDVNIIPKYNSSMNTDDLLDQTALTGKNNLVLPSYDNYSVTAQGLFGSLKPYIHSELNLSGRGRGEQNEDHIYAAYLNHDISEYMSAPSSGIDVNRDAVKKVHFTFENAYNSFLRMETSNIINPNLPNGSIGDNTVLDHFKTQETSNYNNNNSLTGGYESRKREGNYIVTYTNKQIREGGLTGYIEAAEVERENKEIFLDEGIGAYQITTPDGRTYHYSLPVYNFESFYKNFKNEQNEDENFFEIQKTTPYATHWLLTAVTGPDYIDVNTNGKVDALDYGYWVEFEYGKWSDGYGWVTPNGKYFEDENKNGDKTYSYSWGRKQVYYLDAIKTRTHTALFVKDLRADNHSSTSMNLYKQKWVSGSFDLETHSYKIRSGRDYWCGLPFLYRTSESKKHTFYDHQNNPVTINSNSIPSLYLGYDKKNTFKYIDLPVNKTLKLSKIILVKNDVLGNLSKNRGNLESELTGTVSFANGVETISWIDYSERICKSAGYPDLLYNKNILRSFKAHLDDKVLDVKDIDGLGLEEKAQQVISFSHSYDLAKGSVNSEAFTKGRLTLKGVAFKGKGGAQLIPPYKFSYGRASREYDADNLDDWGYDKVYPDTWSLNEIQTPTGGKIKINYEADSYYAEAAYHDPDIGSEGPNGRSGGGLRVKSLQVIGDNNTITTEYQYTDPATGKISGITSFAPSKASKGVPYASELPAPMVMYGHVKLINKDASGKILGSTAYEFETLKPFTQETGYLFSIGDAFKVKQQQNQSFNGGKVIANKYTLYSSLGNIGRLLSVASYNNKGQKLAVKKNHYKTGLDPDGEIGVFQESHKSLKRVLKTENLDEYFYISSTSKVTYPSVLKSTSITQGNFKMTTYFDRHDFLTGQPLETRNTGSDGTVYKTEKVPAYTHYPAMGSKTDDPGNKNMLTQQAANYMYKQENQAWKPLGVGITTWKPWNNDVWRKHRVYTWKGELNTDGTFKNFADNFDWSSTTDSQPAEWQMISEVTKYDVYSSPLETKDVNGHYTSSKTGYNNTKVIATSNTAYNTMFYSGAEDAKGNTFSGGVAKDASAVVATSRVHTGEKSVQVAANVKAFKVTPGTTDTYRLSVWAHKSNYVNTRVTSNGQSFSYNRGEIVIAGDWVQLNFTVSAASGKEVALTTTSGTAYYDDFRLHPVSSSMTSYVYNNFDELTYILGANNMGTRYEYDAAGRLTKAYSEVMDYGENTGGFKMVKEIKMKYQESISDNLHRVLTLYPKVEDPHNGTPVYSADVSGGSGYFEFRWSFGKGQYSDLYDSWTIHSKRTGSGLVLRCPEDNGTTIYYRCQVRDKTTKEVKTVSGTYIWECM